jgi:DNA-binding transcriptional MerR regulator
MLGAMTAIFSPGEAAEQSGFSIDTLRYYERIGLLGGIERTRSGHRRFRDDDLEWLGVLRCLRETGMPIAQMRAYAELNRHGRATMASRLHLLVEHDRQVQDRIAQLQDQRVHLQDKIRWYRHAMSADSGSASDCCSSDRGEPDVCLGYQAENGAGAGAGSGSGGTR